MEQMKKEDALLRKEELLKLINEYNVELLEERTTTYTEEEIDAFQKELEDLDCFFPNEIVKEKSIEVETEKKPSFLDKVSVWIYPYIIVLVCAGLPILQRMIGLEFFSSLIVDTNYYTSASNVQLGFATALTFIIYPLILLIISSIVTIIFANKNKPENRKMLIISLIVIICIIICSFLYVYISELRDFINQVKEIATK